MFILSKIMHLFRIDKIFAKIYKKYQRLRKDLQFFIGPCLSIFYSIKVWLSWFNSALNELFINVWIVWFTKLLKESNMDNMLLVLCSLYTRQVIVWSGILIKCKCVLRNIWLSWWYPYASSIAADAYKVKTLSLGLANISSWKGTTE